MTDAPGPPLCLVGWPPGSVYVPRTPVLFERLTRKLLDAERVTAPDGRRADTRRTMYSGTCVRCGKPFASPNPDARHCTRKCGQAGFHEARRAQLAAKPPKVHVCRICKENYTPKRNEQRVCFAPACRATLDRRGKRVF